MPLHRKGPAPPDDLDAGDEPVRVPRLDLEPRCEPVDRLVVARADLDDGTVAEEGGESRARHQQGVVPRVLVPVVAVAGVADEVREVLVQGAAEADVELQKLLHDYSIDHEPWWPDVLDASVAHQTITIHTKYNTANGNTAQMCNAFRGLATQDNLTVIDVQVQSVHYALLTRC